MPINNLYFSLTSIEKKNMLGLTCTVVTLCDHDKKLRQPSFMNDFLCVVVFLFFNSFFKLGLFASGFPG